MERAKRVSREMKKAFAKIYTIYFFSRVVAHFVPTFFLKLMGEKMTKPFTMAFSNVPGILSKIRYKTNETTGMVSSFICAGRIAIAVAILSYAETVQFSVTIDTSVQQDPKEIRTRIEAAIDELLLMAKQKHIAKELVKPADGPTDTKKK